MSEAGCRFRTAAWQGNLEEVKKLRPSMTSLTEGDPEHGYSAVVWAAISGYVEVVKYLISEGSNVHANSRSGRTALHESARLGMLSMVQYLVLEEKMQPQQTDKNGDSAIDLAKSKKQHEVVVFLENSAGCHFGILDGSYHDFLCQQIHRLQGQKPFSLRCPNAERCWAGLHALMAGGSTTLDTRYLTHAFDKCYCSRCQPGLQDARCTGGWVRFGLHVDDARMQALAAWNWDKCFHGTKFESIAKIVPTGYLVRPGSFTSDGFFIDVRDGHIKRAFDREYELDHMREGRTGFETTKRVEGKVIEEFDPTRMLFVSQSLAYASHKVYAETITTPFGRITCVLELRLKPGFYDVGPSTVTEKVVDPQVRESQMEWYTDRFGVHVLTGLLVRVQSNRAPFTVPITRQVSDISALPIGELQQCLIQLQKRSCFSLYCRSANLCWAALQSLNVNPSFFDHDNDKCYCSVCGLGEPECVRRGNPIQRVRFTPWILWLRCQAIHSAHDSASRVRRLPCLLPRHRATEHCVDP